jgi:hypothetical protein
VGDVERQAYRIANNCGAEITDTFLDFYSSGEGTDVDAE